MRVVIVDNHPKVVFFAERDIEEGEELAYDYGENRKDARREIGMLSDVIVPNGHAFCSGNDRDHEAIASS